MTTEHDRENITIGDIESNEKGSAARNCIGKTPWSFMPLAQLSILMREIVNTEPLHFDKISASNLTATLSCFQETGSIMTANALLLISTRYLMQQLDEGLDSALSRVVKVWELGEKKYAKFNWMKGMAWSEVVNSAQRHIMALYNGVELDEESGEHHAAHLICNAMMLVHYVSFYPEGNDLPVKWFSH